MSAAIAIPGRRAAAGLNRRLGRRGASSLEFAIVALPLLLLILSGLELARYAATVASLRAVVDEAVRTATLRGYANLNADQSACTGLGANTNLVPAEAPTYMLHRNRLTFTVTGCATNGPITTVAMRAQYQHVFLFAALSPYSGTLVETATASFN
jgi:Flp pilus assembly protein TadG